MRRRHPVILPILDDLRRLRQQARQHSDSDKRTAGHGSHASDHYDVDESAP